MPIYMIDDIYALPDEQRAELIDGMLNSIYEDFTNIISELLM